MTKTAIVVVALLSGYAATWAQPTPPDQEFVLYFDDTRAGLAPVSDVLNLGATFTMETWLWVESADPFNIFLGKQNDDAGTDPWKAYSLGFGDKLQLEFLQSTNSPGSLRGVAGSGPAPTKRWIHVAGVLDNGILRLYVDGQLVGQSPSAGLPNSDLPFGVGGGAQASGYITGGFRGALRQVRVWNRPLAGGELNQLAGQTLAGTETGLLAYWPLDEAAGDTARDRGPFELHLGLHPQGDGMWIPVDVLSDPVFLPENRPIPNDFDAGLFVIFPIDLKGDGYGDVVIPSLYWPPPGVDSPLLVIYNDDDGPGSVEYLPGHRGNRHPRDYTVADFSGDGRLDLYIVDHGDDIPPFPGGQSLLFVQQLDGSLADETPGRIPERPAFTHSVTSGDFDQDGDVDIYMCNIGGGVAGPEFYLNDGNGHFSINTSLLPTTLTTRQRTYTASRVVDVDRDGNIDIVLGGHPGFHAQAFFQRDAILVNDGTGRFTFGPEETMPPRFGGPDWGTVAIEPVDVNGDGWLDLVLAVVDATYSRTQIQLLLNNGDGTFVDATDWLVQPPHWDDPENVGASGAWVIWTHSSDFNLDGWMDLLVDVVGESARLYLNQNGERFVDASYLLAGLPVGPRNRIDLDGDGDVDIVGGGYNRQLVVLTNLRSYQVSDLSLPLPAAPVLIRPVSGAGPALPVTLRWNHVETAYAYDIQLSSDADFNDIQTHTTGWTSDRYPLDSLDTEATYFWRVRARNTRGQGPWSNVGQFKVGRAPHAVIEANPVSGAVPLTVTFSASQSTDPDNDPLMYTWRFGDEDSASGVDAVHTFTQPGTYTSEVAVSDGTNEDVASMQITVSPGGVSTEEEEELPRELGLVATYPNPFRNSATIAYELPAAGEIRLSIIDMMGREVSLLDSGWKAAGLHEVQFETASTASGLYLCLLASDEGVDVHRIVIAR